MKLDYGKYVYYEILRSKAFVTEKRSNECFSLRKRMLHLLKVCWKPYKLLGDGTLGTHKGN
jgi:hypothetical protein